MIAVVLFVFVFTFIALWTWGSEFPRFVMGVVAAAGGVLAAVSLMAVVDDIPLSTRTGRAATYVAAAIWAGGLSSEAFIDAATWPVAVLGGAAFLLAVVARTVGILWARRACSACVGLTSQR